MRAPAWGPAPCPRRTPPGTRGQPRCPPGAGRHAVLHRGGRVPRGHCPLPVARARGPSPLRPPAPAVLVVPCGPCLSVAVMPFRGCMTNPSSVRGRLQPIKQPAPSLRRVLPGGQGPVAVLPPPTKSQSMGTQRGGGMGSADTAPCSPQVPKPLSTAPSRSEGCQGRKRAKAESTHTCPALRCRLTTSATSLISRDLSLESHRQVKEAVVLCSCCALEQPRL